MSGKLHLSAAQGRVEIRPNDGYRFYKWSHHPKPEPFWPTEQHDYQQWLKDEGIDWDEAYGSEAVEGWDLRGLGRTGIAAKYHQTTWCANEAISFITEQRDGHWLMSVNPFDPHPPFDPPAEYLERMDIESMPLPLFLPKEMESQLKFQNIDHQTREPRSPHDYDARKMVAAYYAQIELIDDQVGRMIEALESTGQRENTIIIFTSDHGEMLGDHGLLFKGCRFYEGAVHIPLIVSWPGHFQRGVHSNALVELTDIVPTLLEVNELPIPEYMRGKSLLPILTGEATPEHHRDFVRCEYHAALGMPNASHANMIFDGRHKLVIHHGQEMGELYDLQEDSSEFRNLWDDPDRRAVKYDLVRTCFDEVMISVEEGQPLVGGF